MQTGVYQHENGGVWLWRCECGAVAELAMSREQARNAYKAHRREGCVKRNSNQEEEQMTPSTETKPEVKASEVKVPAKKKTTVKKKAVAKKKTTVKKKAVAKKKTTVKKKAVAEKKGPTKKGEKKLWRFGIVKNKRGKTITPRVGKTGHLSNSVTAESLGIKQAPKWGKVRADTAKEAIALLRAGKGDFFTPSKGEKK